MASTKLSFLNTRIKILAYLISFGGWTSPSLTTTESARPYFRALSRPAPGVIGPTLRIKSMEYKVVCTHSCIVLEVRISAELVRG